MKRLLLLGALFVFGSVCSASLLPAQNQSIQYTIDFLTTHGDSIDQRVGILESTQSRVRQARIDLLEKIGGGDISYQYFKDLLQEYVQTYMTIKKQGAFISQLPSYDEPSEAMVILQKQFLKQLQQGQDFNRPVQELSHMTMSASVLLPFIGLFQGSMSIDARSKMDVPHHMLDSLLAFNTNASIPGGESNFSLTGVVDIKMPGNGKTYIGLAGLAVEYDGNEGEVASRDAQQMIDLLDGRYIEMPQDQQGAFPMPVNSLGLRHDTLQTLNTQSLLHFIHKEGNTYYGVFDYSLCSLLANRGVSKSDCYENIDSILFETQGKGPITLTVQGGVYTLGLYNFDGTMPQRLNGVHMVTRDSQGLKNIYMPLDDGDSYISYDGYKRKIDVSDIDTQLHVDITTHKGVTTLGGALQIDDVLVDMTGKYSHSPTTQTGTLLIHITQGGVDLGSFEMSINSDTSRIHTFQVDIPSSTITMDELQLLMQSHYQD